MCSTTLYIHCIGTGGDGGNVVVGVGAFHHRLFPLLIWCVCASAWWLCFLYILTTCISPLKDKGMHI